MYSLQARQRTTLKPPVRAYSPPSLLSLSSSPSSYSLSSLASGLTRRMQAACFAWLITLTSLIMHFFGSSSLPDAES
jgi:hypothetical protein